MSNQKLPGPHPRARMAAHVAARMEASETAKRAARLDADRRSQILAAASEVFLEMGYGNATIDEVIRRVGGSKRTLYRHFESKEALFGAVVDEVVGEIVRPLSEFATTKLSARDTLLILAIQHMTVVLSDRHIALMRLVAAEAARVPEVGRAYYEHGPGRGHAKLRLYFEQQRRRGVFDMPDVARAADYFWGMLLHHGTLRRLFRRDPPPTTEEIATECTGLVDAFLELFAAGAQVPDVAVQRRSTR
ncbi:MAG: TetR/AcrR family transcriptional regulator [Acidobacteria bacterium]|nr:TetR/AcrR family transcriptional regulator [Acidobacteriota bacterium]